MDFDRQVNEHILKINASIERGDTARNALTNPDPTERLEAFNQLVTTNQELTNLLTKYKQLADSQNIEVLDGPQLFRRDYEAIKSIIAPDASSKKRRAIDSQGLHVCHLEGFKQTGNRIVEVDLRRDGLPADVCMHLRKLTELKHLQLNAPAISSLDGLKSHPSIERLFIGEASQLQDFSVLSTLPKLSSLGIFKCNVDDANSGAIFSLSSLTSLDLTSNPLSSLHGIEGLRNLEHLSLWRSPIASLLPLTSLPSLRTVSLGDIFTDDLTPLLTLPHLSTLHISKKILAHKGKFSWLSRSSTPERTVEQLRKRGVTIVTMT